MQINIQMSVNRQSTLTLFNNDIARRRRNQSRRNRRRIYRRRQLRQSNALNNNDSTLNRIANLPRQISNDPLSLINQFFNGTPFIWKNFLENYTNDEETKLTLEYFFFKLLRVLLLRCLLYQISHSASQILLVQLCNSIYYRNIFFYYNLIRHLI